MVTFQVDDVTPATDAVSTRPLRDLFPEAVAYGGDPDRRLLDPNGVDPLLHAVGKAFAEHRPLALTPDAIWLTILRGLAQHIRLHAEELRPRLVAHAGKKRLTVAHLGAAPADAKTWADIVDDFHQQTSALATGTELFDCDFSTSTDADRLAGRVVLLDAYSRYFALWMVAICGIPRIAIEGTVEDWRKVRTRIDAVADLGLERWCRSLRPIADEFVLAAEGRPDIAFWQRIYNPVDAYGGEVITGWITRLYPYLRGDGVFDKPNPMLDLPIDEPRNLTDKPGDFYFGPGSFSSWFPAELSIARINVNDQVIGDNHRYAVHAGLVGVAVDHDGALRPVSGWHVAPSAVDIDDVVDRLLEEHQTEPAADMDDLTFADPDMVGLYRRVGSASIFGGSWRLRPLSATKDVWQLSLIGIIDVADGRTICGVADHESQTMQWALCRLEATGDDSSPHYRLADELADVPLLGSSLAVVLDAALDSGGDVSHLEVGRLSDLL